MMRIDPARTALLVIDMQPDVMPEGALPVQGAADHHERLVVPVRDLMDALLFPLQVATQDWHPPGHVSFASSHPGRAPFDSIEDASRDAVTRAELKDRGVEVVTTGALFAATGA